MNVADWMDKEIWYLGYKKHKHKLHKYLQLTEITYIKKIQNCNTSVFSDDIILMFLYTTSPFPYTHK